MEFKECTYLILNKLLIAAVGLSAIPYHIRGFTVLINNGALSQPHPPAHSKRDLGWIFLSDLNQASAELRFPSVMRLLDGLG